MAISSFSVGGGALISSIVFGALSVKAKNDFEDTEFHKPSVRANEKYKIYSGLFWGSMGVFSLGVLFGALLFPKRNRIFKSDIALSIGDVDTMQFSVEF